MSKHTLSKKWSPDEQQTWRLLATRQLNNGTHKLSQFWFKGFATLGLTTEQIPDFNHVSSTLKSTTGWQLVKSNFEYADGQTWFSSLKQNTFLVTDYLRPLTSLDYTPLPDMFHDAFGHLPFLVNPQLSRIIRKFTDLILSASLEERVTLGRIWWYTIEFGLVKEEGGVRAIGAGLASSFGELNRVFDGTTSLEDFDFDRVGETPTSASEYHQVLFVHESLDHIEQWLNNWPLERK